MTRRATPRHTPRSWLLKQECGLLRWHGRECAENPGGTSNKPSMLPIHRLWCACEVWRVHRRAISLWGVELVW